MPELPEVEVTRLSLAPRIEGAVVQDVRLGAPLRWPLGCEPSRLVGRRIVQVSRRGKYLWMAFGEGGGLLLHLGMSGSLSFEPAGRPPGRHDHFDLVTAQGVLRLHDPRRFGAVVWGEDLHEGRVARLLQGLGVEPFSATWTAEHLHQGLRGRRVAVKQALLSGDIVVGVGNIYASEALFRAGIHPGTPSGRIGLARCGRLVSAVREVLAEAVAAGGSTLRDFRNALGEQGHFQLATRVYDRAGQPCLSCATEVRRLVQGQRSTYFCPRCQRR